MSVLAHTVSTDRSKVKRLESGTFSGRHGEVRQKLTCFSEELTASIFRMRKVTQGGNPRKASGALLAVCISLGFPFDPENERITSLRKAGKFLPDVKVSHSRR
jgi:hypothetical protein